MYKDIYDSLQREIHDSFVAVLEKGGENIVDIIGKHVIYNSFLYVLLCFLSFCNDVSTLRMYLEPVTSL